MRMPPEQRRLWLGTSWKMNKTLAEARAYIDQLLGTPIPAGIQPFLLPPATALAAVRDRLPDDCAILLGIQNAHPGPEGAPTGEISMRMAADAGARLVEIGHSERRASYGETDASVAAKVAAAVADGLTPLVCVGEPIEVREAGTAEPFVAGQLRAALAGLAPADLDQVLIAYEPVWAIGDAGRPAQPDEVAPVLDLIAATVRELSAGRSARAVLYGGSVDLDDAAALLTRTPADGLFVGRAAWTADGFAGLLAVCAPLARQHDQATTSVPGRQELSA